MDARKLLTKAFFFALFAFGFFGKIPFNKIFSGRQPRQGVKTSRRSRERAISPQLRKMFTVSRSCLSEKI